MLTLLLLLMFALCLFLILLILVQSSRGGGLAGALTGVATDSLFSAGSRNPLRRITAVTATIFFLLCLVIGVLAVSRGGARQGGPVQAPVPVEDGA